MCMISPYYMDKYIYRIESFCKLIMLFTYLVGTQFVKRFVVMIVKRFVVMSFGSFI